MLQVAIIVDGSFKDISGDNLETTAGSKVFKGVIEDDDNGIYVNRHSK